MRSVAPGEGGGGAVDEETGGAALVQSVAGRVGWSGAVRKLKSSSVKMIRTTAKMVVGGSVAFIVLNLMIALWFLCSDNLLHKRRNIIS
ncbi:MAG TPA: hypothetical protein VLX44_09885, partial [Xanthobacteraceae bacterium]|nr:hypothetical protein [Xanthobacteraceae bacterium]